MERDHLRMSAGKDVPIGQPGGSSFPPLSHAQLVPFEGIVDLGDPLPVVMDDPDFGPEGRHELPHPAKFLLRSLVQNQNDLFQVIVPWPSSSTIRGMAGPSNSE